MRVARPRPGRRASVPRFTAMLKISASACLRGKRRSLRSRPSSLRTRLITSSLSLRSRIVKLGERPTVAAWRRRFRCANEWKVPPDDLGAAAADEPRGAAQHLLRRLAREREEQDRARRHARFDETRDPVDERTGLAAAGAGDDEDGPLERASRPRAAAGSARRRNECGIDSRPSGGDRHGACSASRSRHGKGSRRALQRALGRRALDDALRSWGTAHRLTRSPARLLAAATSGKAHSGGGCGSSRLHDRRQRRRPRACGHAHAAVAVTAKRRRDR